MTATVDTNVFVHASSTSSPRHAQALDVLERVSTGPALLTLFWPVLLGYVRIVTNPLVVSPPLSKDEAMSNLDSLLSRPHVRTAGERNGFWQIFRSVTAPVVVRGKMVTDAHIAALMHQHGVREIWTHDRDFRKFDGIAVRDPFAR